jgi:RNA polymerase sigma-70 factor (TIGR02957 family)
MTSESGAARDDLDRAVAEFATIRPRLFGIAYRMLGSATEAEDIVQEVWLKWQKHDRAGVRDPAAFLSTMTTRLSINEVTSARARRETYVGPWLPEPVDTQSDPALGAERAEAVGFAVLVLMEKLSGKERAAYVLREAFDYSYADIAAIIQTSEAAVRQLVSRARKHLSGGPRTPVDPSEQQQLLEAFIDAAQRGDLAALEELFTPDVVSLSDGGGVVRASRIPVLGRDHVSRYIRAFASRFWQGVEVSTIVANGQSSALLSRDGVQFAVVTIDASADGIDQVLWMMNPGKLGGVASAEV